MKILLLGEYSHLHNTLKKGFLILGHEVVLVGDGDGFKNFPVDISIKPNFTNNYIGKKLKVGLFKITKIDLGELERGIRFYFHLNKFKGFDVVQLINEKPIKTSPFLERFLLKKIFKTNSKTILLSCGVDFISVQYMLQKKFRYSLMDPFFKDPTLKNEYRYVFNYVKKGHEKTHQLVFKNIQKVIASDMDYVLPLKNNDLFYGLIPNPIDCETIPHNKLIIKDKITLFLGINRGTYTKKGIPFFEEALTIIEKKYVDKVKIIIAENIPYKDYLQKYKEAHILLDQVYAYDQGYNALEAMAFGKVVFTGAEKEFLENYKIAEDEVCINALPNTLEIVKKLSWLIENPSKIIEIGINARSFIEKHHHHKKIAEKYLEAYEA